MEIGHFLFHKSSLKILLDLSQSYLIFWTSASCSHGFSTENTYTSYKNLEFSVEFAEFASVNPENKGTSGRKDRKDGKVFDLCDPYVARFKRQSQVIIILRL